MGYTSPDIVNESPNPLPTAGTAGAAGYDLCANQSVEVGPGETTLVGTGLKVALQPGTAMLILPRSGLAATFGITVANAPGLVDEDYRGEIKVCLVNHSGKAFAVSEGMRIAQAMIVRYEKIVWNQVTELDVTDRGEGGFGSTGVG